MESKHVLRHTVYTLNLEEFKVYTVSPTTWKQTRKIYKHLNNIHLNNPWVKVEASKEINIH